MTATSPLGVSRLPGRTALADRSWAVSAKRVDGVDLFVFALLGMVLTYVWRVNILWAQSVFVPLRMALVFTGLTGLGWFLSRDPRRRLDRFVKLRLWKLVAALGTIVVVSMLFGAYPTQSFVFFRKFYLGVFLFMLFTVVAIRTFRDIERIVAAYLVGALLYSIRILQSFQVGRTGRLGDLIAHDANDLAMFLVVSIPLAVYFLRSGVRPLYRGIALLGLVVFVIALVETGSRGGFLGFLVVLLFLLLRYRSVSRRVRIAAITIGLTTLFFAGTDAFWTQMQTMLHPTEDYNYAGQSAGGRMEIWKRAGGYVKDRPIGWGIANFGFAEGGSEMNRARSAEGKGWVWSAPHNSFVQIAVELGPVGLLIFLWVLGAAVRALNRLAPRGREGKLRAEAAMGQAIIGALVGFCVCGFFLSQAYSSMLYGILGLAIGLLKLEPPTALPASGRRKVERRSVPQPPRMARI